jgi:hypothetical protein
MSHLAMMRRVCGLVLGCGALRGTGNIAAGADLPTKVPAIAVTPVSAWMFQFTPYG